MVTRRLQSPAGLQDPPVDPARIDSSAERSDFGGRVGRVCGRATLVTKVEEIAEIFEADPIDIGPARYNIAPTQPMLTVRARSADAPRELHQARWGLIPWWAKPDEAKKIGSRCIQARAETVPRAAAFRDAFRRHRCLVVIDGFFEWKTLADGKRAPYLARRSQRTPLAIAGLWDTWRAPADQEHGPGNVIESCAVVTTPSAGALRDIHDRMPLLLSTDEWNAWLTGTADEAAELLASPPPVLERRASELVAIPVSTRVNNVRNDDPECIAPLDLEAAAVGGGG